MSGKPARKARKAGKAPARPSDRDILATRVFDAPAEAVFEAWIDPARAAHWWGPAGFKTEISGTEARPEGAWRFVMRVPGGEDRRGEIVFRDVVRPERLVYDSLSVPKFEATAAFERQGVRTKVSLRMRFATSAECADAAEKFGAVEGARRTLQRLADHLAQGGSAAVRA